MQWPWETQRRVECLVCCRRFSRGFPFAVNRRESARVHRPSGRRILNGETVFPEVGRVEKMSRAPRPRSIGDNAVDTDDLRSYSTGVEVIDAHRLVAEVRRETSLC